MLAFALVSGSGTVVNLVAFALLHHVVGLPPILCGALAFAVACQHNATWHAHVTFRVRAHSRRTRYAALSLATLAVNLAVLHAIARAGVAPVVAQAVGIAAAAPLNFLGSRRWVFAPTVRSKA
jgi:putative flippase GtrA